MAYIEGFVAAVPRANKEAYRKHAEQAAPYFKKLGATRMVENWGDDVPDGKITDFKGAVQAINEVSSRAVCFVGPVSQPMEESTCCSETETSLRTLR